MPEPLNLFDLAHHRNVDAFIDTADRIAIIESPYQNGDPDNVAYLDAAIRHEFKEGNIPVASHKLFPGALQEHLAIERNVGMYAGWALMNLLASSNIKTFQAVYTDRGITRGMERGIETASALGIPITFRRIGHG